MEDCGSTSYAQKACPYTMVGLALPSAKNTLESLDLPAIRALYGRQQAAGASLGNVRNGPARGLQHAVQGAFASKLLTDGRLGLQTMWLPVPSSPGNGLILQAPTQLSPETVA